MSPSDGRILAAIESLADGRTVLLASHREHPAIGATRTIELDHGQLTSAGPVLPSGMPLPAGTDDPAGPVIGQ